MGHNDVPDVIPDEVLHAIASYFPDASVIMIVSEHPDGSATTSMAGKHDDEVDDLLALQAALNEWVLDTGKRERDQQVDEHRKEKKKS